VKFRRRPNERRQPRLDTAERLASAPTMSYRSSRSDNQEPNTKRGDSLNTLSSPSPFKRLLARSGLILLSVAIILSVANLLTLSNDPRVMPLDGTNSPISSAERSQYEKYASSILAGSIPDHTKITVNTSDLSKKLSAQFPGIADVQIVIPLFSHRPVIYIQPSKPILIINATNGYFAVDTNGRVVSQAVTAQGLNVTGLPLITDTSNLQPRIGQQVLPESDTSFIQTILVELSSKGYTVQSMSLPAAANELDVHLAGQQYYIKFNLQNGDARQQAGTFLAVISQLQSQHITPGQYVDVRVDGRAYYQ
jgi:hypothetical protein